MEARLEKVESKVNEVAKTETIELDPLEEDEEEPTFQSRVVPLLSSIPHAETAYAKLAPHAATAWERVKQGAAQAREHTKDYEEQAKEALAPVTAAVAPHVATAKSMISRALQLSDPVLVEVEKEAGAELDVTLKTSLFTGRVVVERVAASSPALGQIAAGDTLIEVMGRPPKNATHAASLLKRASALTMLVQPGKRKLGSIPVVGPEVSDLAVVGRLRWRGMLTIFFGMWLLLSVVGAPASWMRDYSYRSQLARQGAQLQLSKMAAESTRHVLAANRQSALVQMKQLLKAKQDNATAHAEYERIATMYERMKAELAEEKARHKQAIAVAKAESSTTGALRARQQALRQKFMIAKTEIEKKWRDYQAELQKAANALDSPAR